jgi:hypothetical protein
MEIKSLKDLKIALSKIPEKELDLFGVSADPEGGDVKLLCWDYEKDPYEKWEEIEEKYPEINDIDNWIRAIIQFENKYKKSEGDEVEEMISSKDFK